MCWIVFALHHLFLLYFKDDFHSVCVILVASDSIYPFTLGGLEADCNDSSGGECRPPGKRSRTLD